MSATNHGRTDPVGFDAPGALFRNRPGYGPVEYAEVIDSGVDPVGIRHVRFRLFFGYRDKTVDAGERTLAQMAFTNRFSERVSRQAARNGAGEGLRS